MTTLTAKINDENVDCVRCDLQLQTINVGHQMFTLILDNNGGQYNGAFDANDDVEITINNALILNGKIDSVKHIFSHEIVWSGYDLLRVAGRCLSIELSGLKHTKTYPASTKFGDMIRDAFTATGCSITPPDAGSGTTIGGHAMEDEYLLQMIQRVLDRGDYEGRVDNNKAFIMFAQGAGPDSGITVSNPLSSEFIEIDGLDIWNYIEVYGAPILFNPEDKDAWTELVSQLAYWELNQGVELVLADDSKKKGSYCIRVEPIGLPVGDPTYFVATFTLNKAFRVMFGENRLKRFWQKTGTFDIEVDESEIRLITSGTDYFYSNPDNTPTWTFEEYPLGPEYEFDAVDNPDGIWKRNGDPDWLNIAKTQWHFHWDGAGVVDTHARIDGLYRYPKKCYGFAEDGISQGLYVKREQKFQRPELNTNAQCQNLAESLIAKLKNPQKAITVTVPGDVFIVSETWKAFPGHKLIVNIPKLGISSQNYRFLTVEVSCAPRINLRDGHDFISSFSAVPLTWKVSADFYEKMRMARAYTYLKK